jgi:hypothetical protein
MDMASTTPSQRAAFLAGLAAAVLAVALLAASMRGISYGPDEGSAQGALVAVPAALPFGPGEELRYEFGWNGVPAATLSIMLSAAEEAGRDCLVMDYQVRTAPVLERLWPLQSSGRTVMDARTLEPLRAESLTRKRDKQEAVRITYGDGHARVVIRKRRNGRATRKRFRLDAAPDMPAAFLTLRASAGAGPARRLTVLNGEDAYGVTVRAIGPDRVQVKAGDFEAVEYDVQVRKVAEKGVPAREDEARYRLIRVWMAGPARAPVKLESEVFIGRVYAELVHHEPGAAQ